MNCDAKGLKGSLHKIHKVQLENLIKCDIITTKNKCGKGV